MKAVKTLLLVAISLFAASCFDSPDFDDTPKIEFRNICFGIAPDPQKMDSLVIEFDFEDGDGNLGLNSSFRNDPYHEYDLFLADDMSIGRAVRVFYPDESSPGYLLVDGPITGPLIKEGDPIVGLPPNNCTNFKTLTINVLPADKDVFDASFLVTPIPNAASPAYYRVQGNFYVVPNERNKNIFVKFYHSPTPTSASNLTEYEWCEGFDGRFTVLSDKNNSAISGTMSYTMSESTLLSVMSQGVWQIRVTIMDRSFNKSNEISSQVFSLDQITGRCQ